MTYTELKHIVQKQALAIHNVNSFSDIDVYNYLNEQHVKYSTVVIGLETANRTEHTIQYNVILYYVDRLLLNKSNADAVKDDGIRVLLTIISRLPDEVTYYEPIQYTPFEQEFADYCGGAYCRVMLETEFEQGNCGIDDYIEELKTLYITENGVFDVVGYTYVDVNVEGGSGGGISEGKCREIIESYNYATKDEIPSLDGYATEQWVEDQGYLTEHLSLEGYATEEWVEDQGYLTEHLSLEDYATKQYVQDQIIEAGGITIEQVDEEIENKLADKNYATKDEIPSLDGYATEQWVNNQGYLTEHQDLSEYALKSEIPDVADFTPRDEFDSLVDEVEDNRQRMEDIAIEVYTSLPNKITQLINNLELSVANTYATKDEIPSLDGYATEQWVNNQGYLTEHQQLKTINNLSIIGTGNITISSGGSVISLTQAEYDALAVKDPDTLYNITDGSPVATEEFVRAIFEYDENTQTLNINI